MTESTTIKVPKSLRDELNALADAGGRGTTLADVLAQLLEEHRAKATRERNAAEALFAKAAADPDAVAKADRIAKRAVEFLQSRKAS